MVNLRYYAVLCIMWPCEIVAISLKINDYIPAKVQVQGIRQIF